jgi:aminoglycoside phosphotransferase (APT) family kinase protein
MAGGPGLTLLAEGREAEVFLRPDGTLLKLLRDPAWASRVQREAAALSALNAHRDLAPCCIETVEVDGRPGLVLERVPGRDLLSVLERRPWLLRRAGRVMAEVHAAMHDEVAPPSLPELHAELQARIEHASDLPQPLAAFALELLDGLPPGDRLCHGDLHPGNVLGTWDRPVVIDWGDASSGDPVADVARTDLLLRIGTPPPGTSLPLRVLIPMGRRLLADRYLAVYRRLHPVGIGRLERWKVVRAAARFAEGVEEEYEALAAFVDGRRRRDAMD